MFIDVFPEESGKTSHEPESWIHWQDRPILKYVQFYCDSGAISFSFTQRTPGESVCFSERAPLFDASESISDG